MNQTETRSFDLLTVLFASDERLDTFAPEPEEVDLFAYILNIPAEEIYSSRGARAFCRPYLKQRLHKLYKPENLILTNRLVHVLNEFNQGEIRPFWQRMPGLSRLLFEVHILVLYILFWKRHGVLMELKPMEDYDADALDRAMYWSDVNADDVGRICEDMLSRLTGASA